MLARIDNKLAVRISTVSFHFALGVSAIDRIALSSSVLSDYAFCDAGT